MASPSRALVRRSAAFLLAAATLLAAGAAPPTVPAPGVTAARAAEGRALTVSVADAAAVTEGGVVSFPVSLTSPTGGEVTVTWSTADGTATAGEDYVAADGATLTFAPGETAGTIAVQTLDDALDEDEERFEVVLEAVVGAAGLDPTASVAGAPVVDDDDPPALGLAAARAVEGEDALFEATLSAPSGRAVTVSWSTADGTATAGADYTAVTDAMLTFEPGATRATLTVQTFADADDTEGDEVFAVTVRRAPFIGEVDAGDTAAAAGTIVDAGSVPGAPSGLAATAAGARRIELAWTAPATGAAVTGYRIEGSADGGATWTVLAADTGSTATTWADTGLAPGETRRYRVRGLGAAGAGPASAQAHATTHHAVLGMDIVSVPASGNAYVEGERIELAVEMSGDFATVFSPMLELEVGDAKRVLTGAHCLDKGAQGGTSCEFSAQGVLRLGYTVAAGDADADGVRIPADTLGFDLIGATGGELLCPPGDPRAGERARGDGGLRDRGRHRDRGRGLRRALRHPDLHRGRDRGHRHRARARRYARRGRRDLHRRARQPAARDPRGRLRGGHRHRRRRRAAPRPRGRSPRDRGARRGRDDHRVDRQRRPVPRRSDHRSRLRGQHGGERVRARRRERLPATR